MRLRPRLRTRPLWETVLLSIVVVAACACSTGYKPRGMTGGFSETRLSETSYVVRFGVNVFTPPDKVGQLLLRRAAELCLEHGRRYFLVTSPQSPPDRGSSEITIRFLDAAEDSPDASDSVVVIDETAHVAEDRLSPSAAATYRSLTGRDPS